MRITRRVSDFTVEVEVTNGEGFSMVKGSVYSLLRERDPVQFAIDNRAMSGEPIKPVKEVRMPPVLVSNRIPIAIRAADVANAECDRYLDLIAMIQEKDAESLIGGLLAKKDWSLSGHALKLVKLIPDAMTPALADYTIKRFLKESHDSGALGSRARLSRTIGPVLYYQLEALTLLASDDVLNECDILLDLRDRARTR